MEVASIWAQRSTCSRAAVGVVIAVDGRIVSTGYNGAPRGLPHCDHTCDCNERLLPIAGLEQDGDSPHEDYCASLKPCTNAVHAEANAIAFAAKHGMRLEGAELFTTFTPCQSCAQLIVNAGIVRVVSLKEYRLADGLQTLMAAGVQIS